MLIASRSAAWIAVGWSLCLIASLAGWGALVARLLDETRSAKLGLRLGWGTAAMLLLGGPIVALHVAFSRVLLMLVAAGVMLLAVDLWERREAFRPGLVSAFRDASANPATAALALVVVLAALGVLAASGFEPSATFKTDDDTLAYLSFPREMVMTGGSVQPFSYRHAYSLNGQSFLLALLLPVLHPEELFILDRGVFLLIALVMVVGLSDRPWLQRAPYALLPELVLVLLPNTRVNTTSMLTGTVALLTLHLAIERHTPGRPLGDAVRASVGVGLAVGATIVLRPVYGPAVALVLLAAYVPPLWRDRPRWRRSLAEGLVVAAVTLAFLAPWMIAAYRSDATPMFPLLRGTVRKLDMGARGGLLIVPRMMWSALLADDAFRAPLVLTLAGLCFIDTSARRLLRVWVVVPIVTVGALLFFDPRALQANTLRYVLPVILVMVLVVGARATTILEDLGPSSARPDVTGAFIAVVGLLVHLHTARDAIAHQFVDAANTLVKLDKDPPTLGALADNYKALQEATPPGSTILSMTMRPHLFNFARNRVTLLDYPGLAGPHGGFPIDGSDDDYVKYLTDNGVRYLAVSADRPDPYDLNIWRPRLKNTKGRTDVEAMAQIAWAPVFVTVVETMDRLVATHVKVFGDATLTLVDLTQKKP